MTGFVRAHLKLPCDVFETEGVISSELQLRLVTVDAQIEQLLEDAQDEAQAIIESAREQAQVLIERTRQAQEEAGLQVQLNAKTLLEKINDEWKKIVGAIEPTAVAVARLAFDRVCAGASLTDRVDAAARAALRELPEVPVRICLSSKARKAMGDQTHWNDLPLTEDHTLADAAVRVEGQHGACDSDFDLARSEVTNVLTAWAERATELMRNHSPPTASIR
jgi:ElaB/YqjD/DUF883 family membrane-anchored ribosome-binding protein